MLENNLLAQMLELQLELNNNTNGTIWLSGKTKEGRVINWHRCIYMEAVEALDSFNWKHWKDIDANDDMDNIKVEIIDIWHFVMSEIIKQNTSNILSKYLNNSSNFNREKLILSLEKMVNYASGYVDITIITQEFFQILTNAGMSIEELYANYLVKNILNQFRQDNGYKNGTYKKIWNGEEDNAVAFAIVASNPGINSKDFYQKLKQEYKNVK